MIRGPRRTYIWFVLLGLLSLNLGLRACRINADSAAELPNGFGTRAPFHDEAAKAYEARAKLLFGTWKSSEHDKYEYWRKQSPVWVYSLYAWMSIFGHGFASLRMFSVLASLLTLLVLFLILRQDHGPGPALAGVCLLGFNYYYFLYTRLCLMEPLLLLLLLLTVYLIRRAFDKPLYFALACLAWLAALLVKQSALAFFPVLLICAFRILGNPFSNAAWTDRKRGPGWIAMLAVVILVTGLFFWFDYYLRFLVNIRHYLLWDRTFHSPVYMEIQPHKTLYNLRQSLGCSSLVRGWLMMMPAAFVLAVGQIGAFIYSWLRHRRVDGMSAVWILWLVCARLAIGLSPHQVVRFHLIEFIPTIALAAIALGRLSRLDFKIAKKVKGRSVAALVCIIFFATGLGFHLRYIGEFLLAPKYSIRDGSAQLQQVLADEQAVLMGEWAPTLSLPTGYTYYLVKYIINSKPELMQSFGITHLLLVKDGEDASGRYYKRNFPDKFAKREWLAEFEVGGEQVELFRVDPN